MNPPPGSKIQVDDERGYTRIIAPYPSGGVMRFLVGGFLLCWLGGWAFGWISAASQILKGDSKAGGFLIFWLCGWTVGGVFAIWFLYRIFRPSQPETFILSTPTLPYDSGVAPFQVSFDYRSRADYWKRLFR